jgi:hypothetical protein
MRDEQNSNAGTYNSLNPFLIKLSQVSVVVIVTGICFIIMKLRVRSNYLKFTGIFRIKQIKHWNGHVAMLYELQLHTHDLIV